jgi:hypothetical protein
MPTAAVPRGVPKLERVARQLEARLGVGVSVNPLPAVHLRERPSKLFVWKLRHEGRVLAAPAGFELAPPSLFALTPASRFSYAMSAGLYVLASIAPDDLYGAPLPAGAIRAAQKALLHVAQLRLLARERYESALEAALAALGDDRLWRAADTLTTTAGFLSVRDVVLEELCRAVEDGAGRGTVVRNAQFLAISAARGRSRIRVAVRAASVERSLGVAAVRLLHALPSRTSTASPDVIDARRALSGFAAARRDPSWSSLRNVVVDEWPNAHPLLGL